jgi:hypothetical protein
VTSADPGLATWLATRSAASPLADAAGALAAHPRDPLAAGAALRRRHPDLAPEQSAAVLEQAGLRREASTRYGLPATWLLTRDGLEQATRPPVGARRATLIKAGGAQTVLDLTGGLGADTSAFLAAGLAVIAVERDAATCAFLRHNCPTAEVVHGDARDLLPDLLERLGPSDVVFADPARRLPGAPRRNGRALPERDPERWSPPWSAIAEIAHPRIAAKVAPGFTPPGDWRAEWLSYERTLVECALYSWLPAGRAAVLVGTDGTHVFDADGRTCRPSTQIRHYLHEPDPAIGRAQANGALLDLDPQLAAVDAESTWLTGDTPLHSPAVRSYEVLAELSGSAKQQRATLAANGVERLSVKCRDTADTPSNVLRDLGLREGADAVLVVTRRAGRVVRALCRAAASPAN